ncbi:MAG: isoprenylcysteine carboxylmethyltransferase family protein [Acidobacteria bacterium]|nr:isoprenylcysteine carboxylmethyltransferase family protein [Acidobacteriota bacterium]
MAVGLARFALPLLGIPDGTVRWLSLTALLPIGTLYAAIRVHMTGFGAYRRLLGVLFVQVLASQIIVAAGIAILFSAIVLVMRAQLDLGDSWRVGIDQEAKPGLVIHGLYKFSRNPIFLGMLAALVGCMFLIPTALSFLALAGGLIGIRHQVFAEEAFLRRTYGDGYLSYARRVGRFVPWLGRLR